MSTDPIVHHLTRRYYYYYSTNYGLWGGISFGLCLLIAICACIARNKRYSQNVQAPPGTIIYAQPAAQSLPMYATNTTYPAGSAQPQLPQYQPQQYQPQSAAEMQQPNATYGNNPNYYAPVGAPPVAGGGYGNVPTQYTPVAPPVAAGGQSVAAVPAAAPGAAPANAYYAY
ncbi:hypothetical protein HDU98_008382 [Podochytrium sp. JEL0797]|nr:hypothetical protein HDU98_008382 [Podochytrium sp. JEL0797]